MLSLLLPARVWAAEGSSALLLTVAAKVDEAARLEAVTGELLQPLGVQLRLRRVTRIDLAELRRPGAQAYLARVWIAFEASGSARLYLEHGASDRLLVRDVPGDVTNPELVREELAHILQAAVEGLIAGEEVGEPRQEALQQVAPQEPPVAPAREPRAVPPPAPSPTPERRSRARLGVRYEARWLGDGARFEDGPGVFFAWASRFGFELGGFYRRPLRVEQQPVGVRLETLSARALASFAPWRELRVGAGLGADFSRVTPIAGTQSGSELTEPSWRSSLMARLQVSYGYRAWRSLEFELCAGVDLDPSRSSFVFRRSTGNQIVLDPAPLRPFLALGAALQ